MKDKVIGKKVTGIEVNGTTVAISLEGGLLLEISPLFFGDELEGTKVEVFQTTFNKLGYIN